MTLAQQIDELPDKSEIVFIPYANTQQICDAIKGLPEGSLLSASFDERYQVVGTTDDLKALVAENESLKERLNDIDSGMSFDEYRAKCFPNGFERDGGNDD